MAHDELGLSRKMATDVTTELLRFLTLKSIHDKPDGESMLQPCSLVNDLWKICVLKTKLYSELETFILKEEGGRIHYEPGVNKEPDAEKQKYTKQCYLLQYLSKPRAEIWDVKHAAEQTRNDDYENTLTKLTGRVESLASEELGLSPHMAQEVSKELLRFLTLKSIYDKPDEESMLLPCPLVNDLWKTCILHTKFYSELEAFILKEKGGRIHYETGVSTETNATKWEITERCYQLRFASAVPSEVWDDEAEIEESDSDSDSEDYADLVDEFGSPEEGDVDSVVTVQIAFESGLSDESCVGMSADSSEEFRRIVQEEESLQRETQVLTPNVIVIN